MLSPKAVIDHLQMMEREAILSCQMDDRRRKYYYLENDILIDINLKQIRKLTDVVEEDIVGEHSTTRSLCWEG